jgi:hypothetical protein
MNHEYQEILSSQNKNEKKNHPHIALGIVSLERKQQCLQRLGMNTSDWCALWCHLISRRQMLDVFEAGNSLTGERNNNTIDLVEAAEWEFAIGEGSYTIKFIKDGGI